MLLSWLPESPGMVKHLRRNGEKGEQPVHFYGGWMPRRTRPPIGTSPILSRRVFRRIV